MGDIFEQTFHKSVLIYDGLSDVPFEEIAKIYEIVSSEYPDISLIELREKIKKESLYLTDEYKELSTIEKEYVKNLFIDMKDNISSLIRKIKIECFTFQSESDILSYLKSLSNKKENETALEKLKRLSNL